MYSILNFFKLRKFLDSDPSQIFFHLESKNSFILLCKKKMPVTKKISV